MPALVDSTCDGLFSPRAVVLHSIVAAFLLTVCSGTSRAASITYASTNNGSTIVYVVGEFRLGDDSTFAQTTASLSKVFVSFHSPGGKLLAGLGIGRTIHARGYVTYVGAGSECNSACATAWLGGVRRVASARARIGFHAASDGDGSTSSSGNALVGHYLAEIGVTSDRAVFYLTHAGPQNVKYMSSADLRELGIAIEQQEWEQSAAAVANSPAQPTYSAAPEPPPRYYDADADAQPAYQQPAYSPPVYAPPPVVYAPPVYRAPMYMPRMMPRYVQPAYRWRR